MNFLLTLTDPARQLAAAKIAAEQHGGDIVGDLTSGTFFGHAGFGTVRGTYILQYTRTPTNYTVTITEKPLFVSYESIEQHIKAYFGAN